MATYVPNATQATEPVESRTVESAALEFRTLKTSINAEIAALEAEDLELQAEIDAVEVRTLALEQLAFNGSTPGTVVVQRFTTDAVQTAFTLGVTPVTVAAVDAYINGVYQNHDTFSVSGQVVTFTEAPTTGTLELQVSVPLQLGVTTADAVEYLPAGAGAVATTVQSKLRESVSVLDFGAVGDGAANDAAAVTAANTYAQSIGAELIFPPGTYNLATTSYAIDPQKTRWVADGVVSLQWSGAPTSGYAIRVVSGEATAYTTGRKMVATVLDGFSILGGASYASRYTGNAIEIGDGTRHTYGCNFENVSVQGWSTTVYFNSNTWWIKFINPRLIWGDVNMPASPTNFGENNSFINPVFGDGANINITQGEWTLIGGSLDNSTLTQSGLSSVKWFGPHFENPGTTTIAAPYVSLTHVNAVCYLHDVELITNNTGVAGSITTAPFNVDAAVTVGGLYIDGIIYTQIPAYSFDNLISGTGRATVTKPVPWALSNFYFQTFGVNHPGALRNWGFEENSTAGWAVTVTGTSTVAASTTRKRTGSYSGLFTCSGGSGFVWAYAVQKVNCDANKFVSGVAWINRDFTGLNASETGEINCKLEFLDSTGAAISSNQLGGYNSSPNGTNDGSTWTAFRYAAFAPAGTVSAQVRLEFRRPTGTGTAKFYVDDVVLNVC